VPCQHPAACLGAERRIWVIGVGRQTSPYQAVTPAQAAVLRPRYRPSLVEHQRSLTMFLTRHELSNSHRMVITSVSGMI
jgi:hypothetical protein